MYYISAMVFQKIPERTYGLS